MTLNRTAAVLGIIALAGCGAPGPYELVTDPVLVGEAQDAHERMLAEVQKGTAGTGSPRYANSARAWSGLNGCALLAEEVNTVLKVFSKSPKTFDLPKSESRNLEGTWTFANCEGVASSQSVAPLGRCGGTITFSNQGGTSIEQTNLSAVSAGSGAVTYALISATGEGYIVQHNNAQGGSCSQSITNVMKLLPPGQSFFGSATLSSADRDVLILTFILSSTCDAPKWKCSVASWKR